MPVAEPAGVILNRGLSAGRYHVNGLAPVIEIAQEGSGDAALGELRRLGQTNTAQALTQGTGGALLPFTRLKGLEEAIQKLGAELHSQYVLSFVPDDNTPGFHTIEVHVARDDAHVRTRPGYWSTQ